MTLVFLDKKIVLNICESVQINNLDKKDFISFLSHRRVLGVIIIANFLISTYFGLKLSLWHDEAITANAAISFLENGVPEFQSGFEYWRSFSHTLLVAVSGSIIGITDLSLRIPSILTGSLTVYLTYLIGKEFFDRDIGLIASALLAFSAWQIAWSTQVRMYALFQFLYLVSVFLIYLTVESKSKKHMLALLITLFLAIRTHVTGQILPIIAVIYWLYRNRNLNIYKKLGPVFLTVSALAALEFFSIESFLHVIGRFTFNPENIYYYYTLVFNKIPLLSLLGLAGSLIALKKNFQAGFLTALAVFPALYIYIIHVDKISLRYIYFSAPFFTLWSGLAVKYISEKISGFLKSKTNLRIRLNLICISSVFLVLLLGSGFNFDYPANEYRIENDEKAVYSYIEEHGSLKDILITQWTPPATYYYRAPDYSLYTDTESEGYNSSRYRQEYEFEGRELYSGAEFIDTNQKLVKVINKNKRGWIVLRADSYRLKSRGVKNTISHLVSIQEFAGPDIKRGNKLKVWHWNSSTDLSE